MRLFPLCLMVICSLMMTGCDDRAPDATDNRPNELEPGDVQDGEAPVGKEVTLKGEVTKVYDEHTFSLSDEGIDFEKDLIVVTKDPLPFKAEDDAMVTVTGKVTQYSVVEIEKEYGWDLQPEIEAELKDVKWYLSGAKVQVTKPAEE